MLLRSSMVAVILSAVAGCAALESAGSAGQDDDFAHALSVCRFQHTGATNQKLALPATEGARQAMPGGTRLAADGRTGATRNQQPVTTDGKRDPRSAARSGSHCRACVPRYSVMSSSSAALGTFTVAPAWTWSPICARIRVVTSLHSFAV